MLICLPSRWTTDRNSQKSQARKNLTIEQYALRRSNWKHMVSRTDVAYTIGVLAQFIQDPGRAHWEAVKQVITYLGCTKDLWFILGGWGDKLFEGFCDADWESQGHQHSISGYSFHMGCSAATWSSKKRYIIVPSSTKAEYIALTHAAKEALWLWTLIGELHSGPLKSMTINWINQGAIAL